MIINIKYGNMVHDGHFVQVLYSVRQLVRVLKKKKKAQFYTRTEPVCFLNTTIIQVQDIRWQVEARIHTRCDEMCKQHICVV